MRLRLRGWRVEADFLAQGAVAATGLLFITFHLAGLAVPAAHAGLAMRSFGMVGFVVGGRRRWHWAQGRELLTGVTVPVGNDHDRRAGAFELKKQETPRSSILVTCHLSLPGVCDGKGVVRITQTLGEPRTHQSVGGGWWV